MLTVVGSWIIAVQRDGTEHAAADDPHPEIAGQPLRLVVFVIHRDRQTP